MATRRVLLLSNSTLHGHDYLQHAAQVIQTFLNEFGVKSVLFVPFALFNHNDYTKKVAQTLEKWGYTVTGIHEKEDKKAVVSTAEAIFIGGGNTFRLLKRLYDDDLVDTIRKRVLDDGVPYIGSSAGSNVATVSICTTNDMPIVYPPSFKALDLVPFNINPHYLDPDPNSQHMGETRETRIKQYHEQDNTFPVLGLREGGWIIVRGDKITLGGTTNARLFRKGEEAVEYTPGQDLSFLMSSK